MRTWLLLCRRSNNPVRKHGWPGLLGGARLFHHFKVPWLETGFVFSHCRLRDAGVRFPRKMRTFFFISEPGVSPLIR